MNFGLKYFEEAFTTENWILRIYRVKKRSNRTDIEYKEESEAGASNVQALSGISEAGASNPFARTSYHYKNTL